MKSKFIEIVKNSNSKKLLNNDLYSFEVIDDAGNKIESEYLPKKRARKFKRNLDLKGLFYTIWKIDTYFILSELNENSTELN